ncbi:hypothetical protein FS837_009613 [Tulasnella sp. UAMH 9824]|nr:hypothetical protein FS837_009613 [Tulasnella sp. UAMH 9824]
MSAAGETVVKLGVKITYNLNDSPQLRLARHSPTDVTVYDDPDGTSSTTPIGAAKKKSYVGKFAELPLKVCLSALKDASPELLSNPSHDYSVYLNDPTEPSSDGSTSGVLVGKGLLSWGLEPQGEEDQTTVFGKVVKDGIRGQSVLVHLVLEKTARVSRASSSRQAPQSADAAPPAPSAPAPSVPVTGNQNVNVAALLQLLSSAGTLPTLPQMPNNGDVSQLFSALAGVYNLGMSNQPATTQPQGQAKPQPNAASRPVVPQKRRASRQSDDIVLVKEEEEEIQEIECMPSGSSTPAIRPTPIAATRPTSSTQAAALKVVLRPPTTQSSLPKPSAQPAQPQLPSTIAISGARPRKSSGQVPAQPLGDKENLPPAPSLPTSASSSSLKAPTEPNPLSKSKSAPSLPFRGTGAVSTQNLTPFLPVPALQPKNVTQPAHPVVLFVQPIPSTLQRPEVAPAVKSSSSGSSKKKGRDSHLHAGPHGNGWYRRAELPPPVPSSDAAVMATSTAVNSDAPMSDAGDEAEKKDKKKRATEAVDDGGARKKRKKSKVGSGVGPATSPLRSSGARTIPIAATSPVRKPTTTIKKITLKTSSRFSVSTETPPKSAEATPVAVPVKETSVGPSRPPAPVRQLNFLSLGQRPFLRTQSEGFGQLYPNNLLPPRPIATSLASSPAVPGLALPSMPSMVPAPSPTPEPSRPSTPAPAAEAAPVPRPCTPVNAAKVPLPPSTPKRRKKSKSPEPKEQKETMDIDEDDDEGSPLFLPTPQVDMTGSRKGTAGRELPRMMAPPMTPTRPKATAQARQPPKSLVVPSSDATDDAVDAALNSAFDASDDDDAIVPPPSDLYASITSQKAPLDYKALGLPPSSPPSSFADSSSPNVSPRFTLDAVEDEEMVELVGDPEAAMEEEDADSQKEESSTSGSSSDKDTERESSVAESATSSSSGSDSSSSSDAVLATSDAPPPLQPQMDFATLANMLGLVNTTSTCNTASQPNSAVQPLDGPFDFWNALGITPDTPVEPVATNAPASDGLSGMHGSDIFDFDAATAEGLLNVLGGSGISPKKNVGKDASATPPTLDEESFRTLIDNL